MPKQWPPNGELSAWIARQFPDNYQGWAIDVGASDGISVNSTYLLEHAKHWNVLSIEANPVYWNQLYKLRAFVEPCAIDSKPVSVGTLFINDENPEAYSSLRPSHPEHQVGPGWSTAKIPVRTLDECIAKWQFPRLDALCIDTEGTERDVLMSLDLERWRPHVIVVEAWTAGSLDDALPDYIRQPWRSADNDMYLRKDATDGGNSGP